MLNGRVVPVLQIKGNRLVKTRQFKSPTYLGDPINAVRIFNDKEADELVLLDISASKSGRPPNFSLVEKIASESFMPFTYGGGISSLGYAQDLFSLGVERLSVRTALFENPKLVREISERYGSQSLVFSLDVRRDPGFRLLRSNQFGFANKLQSLSRLITAAEGAGVGEIMLNCVYREGTFLGPDLELVRQVSSLTRLPVLANGGVRNLEDIRQVFIAGASAVGAGAFFTFSGPHRAVLLTYPSRSTLDSIVRTET